MGKKATLIGTMFGLVSACISFIMAPPGNLHLSNIETVLQYISNFFPIIACIVLTVWIYTLHEEHKQCRHSLSALHREINSIYKRLYKIEKDSDA